MSQHYSGTTITKQDWETPQEFVDFIEREHRVLFTLDVAATANNRKAPMWYDEEADGLNSSWYGHIVWCNPPYANQKDWVLKAIHESARNGVDVFMLIPARPDTKLFHDWIMTNATSIGFVKGRLNFGGKEATNKGGCAFPSMVVRFKFGITPNEPHFYTLEPDKVERGIRARICANDDCQTVISNCDGRRLYRCAKCVRLAKERRD